jgi:hypothetical protein
MLRDVLPTVPEPNVALLQNLIFFPGPGVLGKAGVQMVTVPFSQMFAPVSWEGHTKLVPAESATVELDQFDQFAVPFGRPKPLRRLDVELFSHSRCYSNENYDR